MNIRRLMPDWRLTSFAQIFLRQVKMLDIYNAFIILNKETDYMVKLCFSQKLPKHAKCYMKWLANI